MVSVAGASGAPIVQAAETPASVVQAATKPWAPSFNLPPTLADSNVATTPHAAPDPIPARWVCAQPMRIYYAAAPSVDSRDIVNQLAYPVEYMRDLGYKVTVVREVAYRTNYGTPTTPGDVLLVVPFTRADTHAMLPGGAVGRTTTRITGGPARIVIDRGYLSSDVLLHEFGHVLGLGHKPGTVMAESSNPSVTFDAAQTAAVDCRGSV